MLRKLNTALGIIAIIGALICGGTYLYFHYSEIEASSVVHVLGGE